MDPRWDDAYTLNTFHGLIESTRRGHILDNSERELVAMFCVGFADFLSRFLATDCTSNTVAVIKEFVQDVGCEKARGTGDKDGFTR